MTITDSRLGRGLQDRRLFPTGLQECHRGTGDWVSLTGSHKHHLIYTFNMKKAAQTHMILSLLQRYNQEDLKCVYYEVNSETILISLHGCNVIECCVRKEEMYMELHVPPGLNACEFKVLPTEFPG